jgi:hypothetical protein
MSTGLIGQVRAPFVPKVLGDIGWPPDPLYGRRRIIDRARNLEWWPELLQRDGWSYRRRYTNIEWVT